MFSRPSMCLSVRDTLVFSSPEPLGSLVSLKYSHGPSSVCPPFSKIFSKTAGPIKAKFHMEPRCDGGMQVCSRGLGHMTKMAAMSIYGKKNFKNLLLQNQRANDLMAWYVALGPWSYYSLFK